MYKRQALCRAGAGPIHIRKPESSAAEVEGLLRDLCAAGADMDCFTLHYFFIENLIRVKHTTVLVSRVEQAEEIPEPEFEMTNGTCASVRLDALIGLAFQTLSLIHISIRFRRSSIMWRSSLDALALRRSRSRETAIPAGFLWITAM